MPACARHGPANPGGRRAEASGGGVGRAWDIPSIAPTADSLLAVAPASPALAWPTRLAAGRDERRRIVSRPNRTLGGWETVGLMIGEAKFLVGCSRISVASMGPHSATLTRGYRPNQMPTAGTVELSVDQYWPTFRTRRGLAGDC